MSFKPIPVEKKVKVIYRVVKGEKIQPIAREAGVDRTSIYLWEERTLSAARETLEPRKRGPKFKKSSKDREIREAKGEGGYARKLLRRKRGADEKAK